MVHEPSHCLFYGSAEFVVGVPLGSVDVVDPADALSLSLADVPPSEVAAASVSVEPPSESESHAPSARTDERSKGKVRMTACLRRFASVRYLETDRSFCTARAGSSHGQAR